MARFHIDQNTPRDLATILRQFGHNVVTARDVGMATAFDAEHLLSAAQTGRTLVTRDKDYIELHVAWRQWAAAWGVTPLPEHAGILIIDSHWPVPTAAREIAQLLQSAGSLTSYLYRYVPGRQWVQPYP